MKRLRLLSACASALLLLSCIIPSISLSQTNPDPHVAIVTALKAGNNEEARALASRALARSPNDCRLLALQGVALTNLTQPQAALQSFRKALVHCPDYLPALEGASQIEYSQQSTETHLLLERIIALQPENVTAHAMLASILKGQDRCRDALPHYQLSKELLAVRPDIMQGLGFCLAESGDLQSALTTYSELLANHPDDQIRYNVALLQWKTHDSASALATLTPLVSEHSEPALLLASKIHEELGQTPEAVSLLRQAILKAPDHAGNYVDFAAIAFTHTSFQVGIDMLNAGLTRLPSSAELYVARGVLEVQLSKNNDAIADFEQAHHLDPKLSFAVDAIGMMQSQQHNSDASLPTFRNEAKAHPEDALLQYLLAEQLSENAAGKGGDTLKEAIEAAKRAVALDPAYQAAHDLLTVLYMRANEPNLAIEQAEIALLKDPYDQAVLYQEMMAYRSLGDKDRLKKLSERFNQVRAQNSEREQKTNVWRLEDEVKSSADRP